MTTEQKYLIVFLTKHLVRYVMQDKNTDIKEAIVNIRVSATVQKQGR